MRLRNWLAGLRPQFRTTRKQLLYSRQCGRPPFRDPAIPSRLQLAQLIQVIIDSFRAFEEKLQAHQASSDVCEYHLGPAIYAIWELQAFVIGDKSDIANWKAARVNPHDLHVTVRSPGAGGFRRFVAPKTDGFWRKLPKQNQDESQQIFR